MSRIIALALLLVFCLFYPNGRSAASKLGFIESILRYGEDVAKLGKKAPRIKPGIKADLIKKYPRLATKSDELLSGVQIIEKNIAKTPAAGKMMESGINPARVSTLAARSPKTVEEGEKIAGIFATAKPPQTAVAKLPPPAAAALRKADGNYREAGEMFLRMEHRGGKRAVEVAARLAQYATPKNAAYAAALGLLAWHMADPEGAEEAVEKFFQEQVAPVLIAPVKGAVNAVGDTVQESLETVTDRSFETVVKYWPALLALALLGLLWRVPNLRRMPFVLLDSFFGRLNKRMAGPENSVENVSSDGRDSGNGRGHKINVYKKRH